MAIQNHLFQPLQWNIVYFSIKTPVGVCCVEVIYSSNFVSLHSSIYLNTLLGFMRICCAKFENWSNYGANKSQHFSFINHVKM